MAWFNSCTKEDKKELRRMVRSTEQVIGTTLPSLGDIYTDRLHKKASCISMDPTHPGYSLFSPFPQGRDIGQ